MRRGVLVAVLVLSACGRSPSSPSTPANPTPVPVALSDFSGYWGGTFMYKACGGLHCSASSDRTDPFSLRLRQVANHVTGVFVTDIHSIEIAGEVQPDGSVSLFGAETTGGSKGFRGDATFASSGLRLDPILGLKGSLRFERRMFPASDADQFTLVADGTIVSAVRTNLDAHLAALSGTWKGLVLVQQCVDASGRSHCGFFQPGVVEHLDLIVTVAGDAASGDLISVSTRIPVAGFVRGRTFDLAGSRGEPGRAIERITGFSATVDDFGRLKGRFLYEITSNGISSTAEVDLLQAVKIS